jgi:ribosomal protein S18 acetylase RimI-like enzyme
MGRLDVVQWGADRLRIGPWRGDPEVAQITPAPGRVPSGPSIDRAVRLLAARGYRSVLTSALTWSEQQPFLATRFREHERLHLLRRDLRQLPDVVAGGYRLRRGRRSDLLDVLAVDAASFTPFWRFDQAGLDDARAATPSSRFRVAVGGGVVGDVGGGVVGYAVTGRAGPIAYLQRLAVRPDHQGSGVGSALVVDGLRWARRRNATTALVNTQESNVRALALYQRLGFVPEPHGLVVLERSLVGLEATA